MIDKSDICILCRGSKTFARRICPACVGTGKANPNISPAERKKLLNEEFSRILGNKGKPIGIGSYDEIKALVRRILITKGEDLYDIRNLEYAFSSRHVICPYCRGKNRTNSVQCPHCLGTGRDLELSGLNDKERRLFMDIYKDWSEREREDAERALDIIDSKQSERTKEQRILAEKTLYGRQQQILAEKALYGQVSAEVLADLTRRSACARCSGSGCSACNQTGRRPSLRPCLHCSGSGMGCSYCGGTG